VVTVPSSAQFYSVYMDRTWDGEYVSYRAAVSDESGGVERVGFPVPVPPPGRAIHVLLGARSLPAGRFVLTMFGVDSSNKAVEVARFPFRVRFE
jgi:hypothetical protein